jgi:hypothetical protein
METPTISSSRPRLKRISVILGAKETILFGGKGNVTSLPTSSIKNQKKLLSPSPQSPPARGGEFLGFVFFNSYSAEWNFH